MGLASYGEYREEFATAFDKLVSYGGGEYDVTSIVNTENPIEVFEEHFGDRRIYPEPFTQRHKDFAFHLQLKTEQILKHLVKYYVQETGVSDIALAGGVFMNCKANRIIKNLDCIDSIFVQPAANDSGVCLGAALEGYRMATGNKPAPNFNHVYFGPEYNNNNIEQILDESKLEYEKTDVVEAVAKLLAEGKLVGWYQGRMEFGARALGNRSILANPRKSDSVDRVNKFVKNREPWRPFAPSIKFEAKNEYLVDGDESPYMILLDEVKDEKKEEVPSIVHVDGTTRPQTVRRETNKKYYNLITEFEEITGTPVVLNTSFNVSGEPIVESPQQAIQDFYSTGLDVLALGDYLLTKE
jgi:carbamoyltransferase